MERISLATLFVLMIALISGCSSVLKQGTVACDGPVIGTMAPGDTGKPFPDSMGVRSLLSTLYRSLLAEDRTICPFASINEAKN